MALLNFDATQVQPDSGQMDPIPAGWYNGQIYESELKPTKAGDGTMLVLKAKVLDGKHVGRVLFAQFNIRNPNPTAQEIAYKQLSAVAHAVGVLQVQDSSQLHGIPLKLRVKIIPATDKYEARNEITAYKNINEPVQLADAAVGLQAPAQANPFAASAGMPAPVANPFPPQFQQMPAQPAPAAIQGAPVQPWMQNAQFQQPPMQQAPQAAPAPMQQAPVEQPAWAQAAAPTAAQSAPVQQTPMSPPVDPAAVQQAQAAVPPWMKQPGT